MSCPISTKWESGRLRVFIIYELQPTIDRDKLIFSMLEGVRNATRQLPLVEGAFQVDDAGKTCIVTPPGSQVEVNVRRFESTGHKSLSSWAEDSFSANDLHLSQFFPEEPAGNNPVCALQLSLIEGGLILGFRMNHAAGDCKAYREGLQMPTYTPDLNRSPYNTPTTGPTIPRQDLLVMLPIFYVMEKCQFKPKPPPPSQSSIYKISEPSTQQLKAHCAPYLSGIGYITSYDCISVLLWTPITRARLHLYPEKTTSLTRFAHPIDVRTRDPENKTSQQYFGNAVLGAIAGPLLAQTLVSVEDRGLATAATLIRQSINAINLSSVNHITFVLASLSLTETLAFRADFTDLDMFMNTWYSGSAEKYDIGTDTVPVAFRLPSSMPGACVIILPNFSREETRVLEVFVQLAVEEHEVLKKDAEFLKYFEVVA